jgi:hypothetical protein
LSWLLQPLDVYVYADLKRAVRVLLHQQAVDSPEQSTEPGSWIAPTARAVKAVLAHGDWSEQFGKLGAGIGYGPVRTELARYVDAEPVYPALPTLAEMATLLHRLPGTAVTRALHQELLEPALRVSALPGDAEPPRGAWQELPELRPASKRLPPRERPAGAFDPLLRDFLWRQRNAEPLGGIVGPPAVQVLCRRAAP